MALMYRLTIAAKRIASVLNVHGFLKALVRTRLSVILAWSAAVLQGLLARVGFAGTAVLGSLWGIPYDHRAERMVVLAKKAE